VEKVRRSSSDHILDRFASPHVAVQGNYIHVAYHDRIDRSIKYWWNRSDDANAAVSLSDYYTSSGNGTKTVDGVTVRNQRWINLDGGYNYYDNSNSATTGNRVRIDTDRTTSDYNDYGTSIPTDQNKSAAGEYNAIDYNSLGYPVIAYYDMKNQKLKIAYATAARPLAASQWDVQDVTVAGTPSGQYVSMRIDRTVNVNRIHLSYYKSDTGELVYISGTKSSSDQSYTFASDSMVVVDSTGAVGKWSDISIDRNGNPWITYQDLTRTGSYDGAKLAYLPGAPKNDGARWKNAANWEAMNIPARYRVQDARLSVENPLDAADPATNGWDAAVGFQSDYFRAAYYQDN
jgi:hypothetical protein